MIRPSTFLTKHTWEQNWNSMKFVFSNYAGLYKNSNMIYDPRHLLTIITFRCNLRCAFCGVFGLEPEINGKYPDMSFELFRNILDKFEGSYLVDLGGGEPFLHRDLFKMIKYGRKFKKIVTINTNGILISDKIEQIISSDLSYLNISINAYNSNDYRHLTNSSSNIFEEVLDNIKIIVSKRIEERNKIKLGVSYVCTKTNYKKMPEMMRLAHELGVDEVTFINLRPIPRDGFTAEYCLYDDDTDVVEVVQSLEKTKFKLEIKGPNLYERRTTQGKLHCFQPFTWFSICPNGDVYTCCVRLEKAGNIRYNEGIWNNDSFRKFRMIMMSRNPNIIPASCKACPNYVGTRSWKTY